MCRSRSVRECVVDEVMDGVMDGVMDAIDDVEDTRNSVVRKYDSVNLPFGVADIERCGSGGDAVSRFHRQDDHRFNTDRRAAGKEMVRNSDGR